MGRRKVITSVYLEPSQLDALHFLSWETKAPMAVHVRIAIDRYIEEKRGEIDAARRKAFPVNPPPP